MCQILTPELYPPIHLRQFDANRGKILYMSDPKTKRPRFSLILKLSDALDGLSDCSCSMYFLGCTVVNINSLLAK